MSTHTRFWTVRIFFEGGGDAPIGERGGAYSNSPNIHQLFHSPFSLPLSKLNSLSRLVSSDVAIIRKGDYT